MSPVLHSSLPLTEEPRSPFSQLSASAHCTDLRFLSDGKILSCIWLLKHQFAHKIKSHGHLAVE